MAHQEQSPARHSIVYGQLNEPHRSPLAFDGVRYAPNLDHRPTVDSIAGIYGVRDAASRPEIVGTKDGGWVLHPLNLENRDLPEPAIDRRHEALARLVGADVLNLGIVTREQLESMAGVTAVSTLLATESARKSAGL